MAESGTWLPLAPLTKIDFRASGFCWYCGDTSRMTWYWLSGV